MLSNQAYTELLSLADEVAARNAAIERRRAAERPLYAYLYVCPTPGCGDYYGSSQMPDLGAEFTGPKCEDRGALEARTGSPYRHSRAACPSCRLRGVAVERALVRVAVPVPANAPPTPALPQRRVGIDPVRP